MFWNDLKSIMLKISDLMDFMNSVYVMTYYLTNGVQSNINLEIIKPGELIQN